MSIFLSPLESKKRRRLLPLLSTRSQPLEPCWLPVISLTWQDAYSSFAGVLICTSVNLGWKASICSTVGAAQAGAVAASTTQVATSRLRFFVVRAITYSFSKDETTTRFIGKRHKRCSPQRRKR